MSFRTGCGFGSRAFELVRRSLLQTDGLPFADALTADDLQAAFDAERVSFCERDDDTKLVYTPAVTLWALLSQLLFTGEQRSCVAAVIRVAAFWALSGRTVSGTNTGAYCRARAKIPYAVVERLTQQVATRCEAAAPRTWRWHGRTVRVVDGATFSLADTPENQAAYPQPKSQPPGLGFPIVRAVALTSLATGMITAAALGPYAGKETGETALLRELFEHLAAGDVLLGDRYYCGWFLLALLQALGVDFVVRLHQRRRADFRKGVRLGKGDHLVAWRKPTKPAWLDQDTYDSLPDELFVREVQVTVNEPGFRTELLVVVTSLVDHEEIPREDLADLYRRRWTVELHLRDIKTAMQLDVLRCQTPAMVQQELWAGLLAYNLIRQSILQSALARDEHPEHLSFTATMQFLANTWLVAAVTAPPAPTGLAAAADPLVRLRIDSGGSHKVGHRPNRTEPRAVKRRPKPHKLLNTPRRQAREQLVSKRAA